MAQVSRGLTCRPREVVNTVGLRADENRLAQTARIACEGDRSAALKPITAEAVKTGSQDVLKKVCMTSTVVVS